MTASAAKASTVVIIDYGSGNLHSAAKAFERAARDGGSGARIVVSADPKAVAAADRVVLPGVGAFADCKRGLDAVPGLREALETAVVAKGRPFLGICVGMQLMAARGLEHGVHEGLGWVPGEVRAIAPSDASLKIPHMGWNTLVPTAGTAGPSGHALLDGITTGPDGWHAYFVHSYHMALADRSWLLAETDYGGPVTALIAKGNRAGTQFHPEKSQKLGLRLIANFLAWRP